MDKGLESIINKLKNGDQISQEEIQIIEEKVDTSKLKSFEKKEGKIISALPIPVIELNERYEIIRINSEAKSLFNAHNVKGSSISKVIKIETSAFEDEKSGEITKQIIENSNKFGGEVKIITNTGEELEGLLKYEKLGDNSHIFSFENRTTKIAMHRKSNDQIKELQEAHKKIEDAKKSKDRFFAAMSHELRAPFNAILGMSEMLLIEDEINKSQLTKEQKKGIETIYNSGNDLLGLIDDILDLSKVESGKMKIYDEKYSISETLSKVAKVAKSYKTSIIYKELQEKGITNKQDLEIIITNSVDKNDDCAIGDFIKIEQIIKNFVSNAIKFTNGSKQITNKNEYEKQDDKYSQNKGIIELGVKIEEHNGIQYLKYYVKDNGIGISNENKEKKS